MLPDTLSCPALLCCLSSPPWYRRPSLLLCFFFIANRGKERLCVCLWCTDKGTVDGRMASRATFYKFEGHKRPRVAAENGQRATGGAETAGPGDAPHGDAGRTSASNPPASKMMEAVARRIGE